MKIGVILVLAFVFRLINLNQSLWLDEATQVLLSREPLGNIIFNHAADFHPPLSYILMHYWLFFNDSEIWLRLLSVIFAISTIWIVYKFSSEVFNRKTGLLSALLLSIAPYYIYYSQEIRMYSEATFFATLSIYSFYKLTKENKITTSLIYILSSVALIYTHYDGFFLIATQLVYLGVTKKNLLPLFLKRISFIILFWLPWLPQFLKQLEAGSNINQYLPGWNNVLSTTPYKALPLTFFKFSFGRIDFDNKIIYIFVAMIIFSVFGFVFFQAIRKIKKDDEKLIIYWLLIPLTCAMLISLKLPIYQPFRILFVLPAFYILLAVGILNFSKLRKIFLFTVFGISLAGLSMYYINPKYSREDWKGAANFIINNSSLDTVVIFAWPEPFSPYQYYAQNKYALGVVKNFPAKLEDVDNNLFLIENKKEVYLFEYLQNLSDPNKFIQQALIKKGFKQDKIIDFRGVGFIYHFLNTSS